MAACLFLNVAGVYAMKKKKNVKVAEVSQAELDLSPAEQRKYDYFFLEALRLKSQNEYDSAFELLQHCLNIHPNAASAWNEISQYYLYLKLMPQAVAAMERAVKNAPDNYWYCQGLAGLYLQQNNLDKASALFEDMTVRFPDKNDPLYSLLEIYNRQRRYDDVIGILNKLEDRMGKNEQLSMEKFRIYLQMKDDKSAFREIESLVEEYPNDMRYQVVLGDVYMQNGKKEEAYAVYQKVLAVEPDNAMAMCSLASYYEDTGQKELYEEQMRQLLLNKKVPSEIKVNVMRQYAVQNEQTGQDSTRVITLFSQIMEQEPDDARLPMLYAEYLLSKKMDEKALPVLKQVLAIDPTQTTARLMLLSDAARKEDYTEIIAVCEAGVEADPEKLEFYFYLAIAYNHYERTSEVIDICQRALEHVTENSKKEMVSDFYTILGDAYHTTNRNEDAYAAYDSALVYNSSNIGALNNYAYYLSVERRDLDKAEEMSYKTVKAEPNNSTYLDTYAWILFEKGNYAEARLYIDDAMKNEGEESEVIVEHCGDIYYMTGDVDAAVEYWEQALKMGSTSGTLKQKIQNRKYIADGIKSTE